MIKTDIFIRRPVLATVVSLVILVLGLRAVFGLSLRQFPELQNTVISVTTAYPGADAELVQGYITSRVQRAIASSDGVDYLTSKSSQGLSVIDAHIHMNFSPDKAFTDISSKVAQVRDQLPRESKPPVINKQTGDNMAQMYIAFDSKQLNQLQISDYLLRVVQPKLETLEGVSKAEILGSKLFAMRVWLNTQKLAAFNMTPAEVIQSLNEMNIQTAAGQTKGENVSLNVKANTDLHTVKQFRELVVKHENNALVRLGDVASVELGAVDYNSDVIFNGRHAVFMGIYSAPDANSLSVINRVRAQMPDVQADFPEGLHSKIVYDSTKYIRSSIHEVIRTLIEATLIVIAVIYLFLGSLRSVIIPVVTIPLSLIGVCTFMLALGYSLNLLTLLAMVLAIGLVVDDAIVVVENVHRHLKEEGMTPMSAAIAGAKEITVPVIAMTITLAAVYAPIGFTSGLTGALFKEFAFTLASAVIISGVIALTLSPMLCSKLLKSEAAEEHKRARPLDRLFDGMKAFYCRRLSKVLDVVPVMVLFSAVVLVSCFFLFTGANQELAPEEDQSILFVMGMGPGNANISYMNKFAPLLGKAFQDYPEVDGYFTVVGFNGVTSVISGAMLKPWEQRTNMRSQQALMPLLQAKLNEQIAGLQLFVWPLPSLPGADGMPIQFVITSTQGYPVLHDVAEKLTTSAMQSGFFMFVNPDLKFDQPIVEVNINRAKAAELGISMAAIGSSLSAALGGNEVSRFALAGRSYEVIAQVIQRYRMTPQDIGKIYVKTASGHVVPLSTVVTITNSVQPNSLNQMQQLNAVTLSGVMAPGVSLGTALHYLDTKLREIAPAGIGDDFTGPSRQFFDEGYSFEISLLLALIIIYLVLSAQYESFRDPFIILISVPMSICGALIPLYFGVESVNIYTKIGLITLVGLISKHGILMVDFANHLQESEGLSKREAIEKAAGIRLRPILMTTAAMVFGVLPLVLSTGAGAHSRFAIGLVVMSGMLIGTLFTLFVVPSIYLLLAHSRQKTPDLAHQPSD